VFEWDYHGINMLMQRLECVGNGGVVEFGNHVEKPRQFRAHVFWGAQSLP
jgi:hypothetical protein